jgi:hypothetical protein
MLDTELVIFTSKSATSPMHSHTVASRLAVFEVYIREALSRQSKAPVIEKSLCSTQRFDRSRAGSRCAC